MADATTTMSFVMNGYLWIVRFVHPDSEVLMDRTGNVTVATTDPNTHCVYLSDQLDGQFLLKVLIHELSHCIMISYDMLDQIRLMVYPEYWIDMEEWICNLIANHGWQIFVEAYKLLGIDALEILPKELERLVQ